MTLHDILIGMAKYTADNPTHGFNSAGKDKFLREARAFFRQRPDQLEELFYLTSVLRRD